MSWRLRVRHHTTLHYSGDVTDSYNEARLTPMNAGGQRTVEHSIKIAPRAHASRYIDYWGTLVHAFDVHEPHRDLEIVAESDVLTQAAPPPPEVLPAWAELQLHADRFIEYLAPSRFAAPDTALVHDALGLRQEGSILDTANVVCDAIRDMLTYEKGTTSVSTTAVEARAAGRGVCQDFVHVGLALLRSLGIPARYVSGYLYPAIDSALGVEVAGESHAWLEAWTGDWVAFDPTNGSRVDERHVVVARGRDYQDVPPLKGIFHGPPSEFLGVSVGLTRLA